jgi:hypothetical protein
VQLFLVLVFSFGSAFAKADMEGFNQIAFIDAVFGKMIYGLAYNHFIRGYPVINPLHACGRSILPTYFLYFLATSESRLLISAFSRNDSTTFDQMLINVENLLNDKSASFYQAINSFKEKMEKSKWDVRQIVYQSTILCVDTLGNSIKEEISKIIDTKLSKHTKNTKHVKDKQKFLDKNINFYKICSLLLNITPNVNDKAGLDVDGLAKILPFLLGNYLFQVKKLMYLTKCWMTSDQATKLWSKFKNVIRYLDDLGQGNSQCSYRNLFFIPDDVTIRVDEGLMTSTNLLKPLV